MQISARFETEKAILDNQQIEPIAVLHITYLNVLQLENRVREYQHFPGQHHTYLNVSKLENAIHQNQKIEHKAVRKTHL